MNFQIQYDFFDFHSQVIHNLSKSHLLIEYVSRETYCTRFLLLHYAILYAKDIFFRTIRQAGKYVSRETK